MRCLPALVVGMLGAVMVPTEASAAEAVLPDHVFGSLLVLQTTYFCVTPTACPGQGGHEVTENVLVNFDVNLVFTRSYYGSVGFAEGDNYFNERLSGNNPENVIFGVINNNHGLLTPVSLSYQVNDCRYFREGCYMQSGTTNSFSISGGIPEPSTWALMLLGFAGIGLAMRRKTSRDYLAALAN